jgi:ABC-type transport system involved in cytochrome bd biosynthesis fused ATPase/permease subunit
LNTSEGEIRVDDIKLDSYNKNWLKQIAYVPQEINIIEDNLRNNIALGEESENINNSKIDNLINILDLENLKKEIGENIVQEKGKNISVGQKQRIGIARALYLDPKLLILDEATSSLDEKTESKIVEFLYQYEKNLTILMVTHKEKILYGCDKIFQILNNSLIKK